MSRASNVTADRLYRAFIGASALAVPLLLVVLAAVILNAAWPLGGAQVSAMFTGRVWDVSRGSFGALPAIVGTLVTSALALLLAAPVALGAAVFISEVAPPFLRQRVAFLLDLLAAIPSVVYGLWGIFVLLPLLRQRVMPLLAEWFGASSMFRGPAYGPSVLAASIILAIMIVPYIASIAREVLAAVPQAQRDAALAMGATPWEMIRDAVLPYARSGLIGAVMLGLGRALGETMAVTMVIGSRSAIPTSLFDPANTMAAMLATEFAEASDDGHRSALMAVAGLLLLITLAVNMLARWLVWQVRHRPGVGRR